MAQQPIWSLGFGGTSTEKIKAIARGDAGKIIVTGTLGSQNCDVDPQSGQTLLSTSGGYDIFLASYSDDNLNWAKTLPGAVSKPCLWYYDGEHQPCLHQLYPKRYEWPSGTLQAQNQQQH